jgi:anti-sigma factor ChrR (cupin superfamily)
VNRVIDFGVATGGRDLPWEPLRTGVEICRLFTSASSGPSAALLRYQPGAEVPRHAHDGYELIAVLSGAQEDERGRYPAGTLVVNPPGSRHHVRAEGGCTVLIVWERPVVFESGEPA